MVERLGAAVLLSTMLTPMIAALIMRIFVSKEGLKGSLGLLRPRNTTWRHLFYRLSSSQRWFLSWGLWASASSGGLRLPGRSI